MSAYVSICQHVYLHHVMVICQVHSVAWTSRVKQALINRELDDWFAILIYNSLFEPVVQAWDFTGFQNRVQECAFILGPSLSSRHHRFQRLAGLPKSMYTSVGLQVTSHHINPQKCMELILLNEHGDNWSFWCDLKNMPTWNKLGFRMLHAHAFGPLINAFQLPSAFLASVSVVCQLLRHSSSFSIHHWQGNVKSLLFHRGNQRIWNSRPCGKIHWRTIPFSSSAAGDSTNQSAVFLSRRGPETPQIWLMY